MEAVLLIGAYLVGAVPFGLVIGRLAGVDVRSAGSGNIGATNVGRLLGRKLGLLTLAADVAKGVLPMVMAGWLVDDASRHDVVVALCGAAAFLGHLFPVYLKFRGGKGVATALGIFVYLTPLAALAAAALFVTVVYNWGYVSLGSLSAALFMPGLVWLIYRDPTAALLALVLGALIWLKHRDNIGRLMRHEEKSWRRQDQP
ncbi:MAG: glycerol-3-phosphate 1-O-acyltransferase PlsY [Thermodesulfobacteriota bacterium]